MKYTKISSDKAYKLYKDGHGETLYFLDYGCKNYSKFCYRPDFWDYTRTRAYFRAFHCFIGEELPKVTVRQEVHLHCTIAGYFLQEPVMKMINSAHNEENSQYPNSDKMIEIFNKAREVVSKTILFDVDSEGNKSNFRFE